MDTNELAQQLFIRFLPQDFDKRNADDGRTLAVEAFRYAEIFAAVAKERAGPTSVAPFRY